MELALIAVKTVADLGALLSGDFLAGVCATLGARSACNLLDWHPFNVTITNVCGPSREPVGAIVDRAADAKLRRE